MRFPDNKVRAILCAAALIASFSVETHAQSVVRYGHTTTLLPNGNILIVGGRNSAGAIIGSPSDVEIFISTSDSFAFGASMGAGLERSSHTATLMSNGKVLVTGGADSSGNPVATAMIYDPIANTWAAAPAMAQARFHHTATLLPSGSVLITGGQTDAAGTVTANCQIFNPSIANWTACPAMAVGRAGHTATLVNNGSTNLVFIAGGYNNALASIYTNTTELFDPTLNAWRSGPALTKVRAFHTATAIGNKQVMISGGFNGLNIEETGGYLADVEVYNPISNTLASPPPPMQERKVFHTSTLEPSGVMAIQGGLGNITTSYFPGAGVSLQSPSGLILTNTGPMTGTIQNTSTVAFQLNGSLAVEVTGDIQRATAYFATHCNNNRFPIMLQDANVCFSDNTSTPPPELPPDQQWAKLDGGYVGCLPDGSKCGIINQSVRMQPPSGTVTFLPQTATSKTTVSGNGSSVTFSPSPLGVGLSTPVTNGTIATTIIVPMPKTDIGGTVLAGTATITGGTVSDGASTFSIALLGGGGSFSGGQVVADASGNGQLTAAVTLSAITGNLTNQTTASSLTSPLNISNVKVDSLQLVLQYVVSPINLSPDSKGTAVTYNFDIATVAVRSMIFGDQERYNPSTNQWSFASPRVVPRYGQSTVLGLNSDTFNFGGRRCNGSATCSGMAAQSGPIGYVTVGNPWSNDGSLGTGRSNHSATVLPDGRVLVAGGVAGSTILNTAEIYNPVTRQWAPTGAMRSARAGHTATLLPNGRVLVTGGFVNKTSTGSTNLSEIYYPDSGQWVPTSVMISSRQAHTATLLPDGSVLAVGGFANGQYLNTAEIYYSTSGIWQPIGNIPATGLNPSGTRADHTSTLLWDGRVLVVGGFNGTGVLRDVVAYDPAGGWVTTPAPMPSGIGRGGAGRFAHTATLLRDGRVLVAGGDDGFGEIAAMEIYDPRANSWATSAALGFDMIRPRLRHTATLLPNGKVLVSGGITAALTSIRETEWLDMDFSTWSAQGDMGKARGYHQTVLLGNGRVLNIGGSDSPTSFLPDCDSQYFEDSPDAATVGASGPRQPSISSVDKPLFDRGQPITLTGLNFKGQTEASGGGSAAQNSSHHNPRVILEAMSTPSSFMLDLTQDVYKGPSASAWNNVDSSITVAVPSLTGLMPYGWYFARVGANAQYADGLKVQAGPPLPTGAPSAPVGVLQSATSVLWSWTPAPPGGGTISGYNVYSASNSVFISTLAVSACSGSPATCQFLQTGIGAGTASNIKVAAFNLSGDGPVTVSTITLTTPGGGGSGGGGGTGAPPGGLQGSVDPSQTFTLTGLLSSGRAIYIRVPAGTFDSAVTLTVVPSTAVAACRNPASLDAAMTITTNPPKQPTQPITLGISYLPTDPGIPPYSTLSMVRYDGSSKTCVPMTSNADTSQTTVFAQTNHLSSFQLAQVTPQAAVGGVRVYPNPIHISYQGFMTFDQLPAGAHVRIYTLHGEEVFDGVANGSGSLTWAVTNKSQRPVASGIYVAVIDSGSDRQTLKVAVVR